MNTLEVLTLVLVIFAALTYIEIHQNRKQLSSRAIEDSYVTKNYIRYLKCNHQT